jgi:transposase
MFIPFKSDFAKLDKAQHFSGNLFDLLPDDHDCFVFKDLFEQLDTSDIEAQNAAKDKMPIIPKK